MSEESEIEAEIINLEEQIASLREERKDAIQGNMGFSFGYDPAVAAFEQQIRVILTRIRYKQEKLEEMRQLQLIPPVEKVVRLEEQVHQKDRYHSLPPDKGHLLRTLDVLEQELRIRSNLRDKLDDKRLETIVQQIKGAYEDFRKFKDDQRFGYATADLQKDIDECRAVVADATASLNALMPVLNAESEERMERTRLERKNQELKEQEELLQRQVRLRQEAEYKAKREKAEQQRVKQAQFPVHQQPASSSSSSTGQSGTGCILPVLGIVAFIAIMPFLIQLIAFLLPIVVTGGIIVALFAVLSSKS